MAAMAAALPTGGARKHSSMPSARSWPGRTAHTSAKASIGTPKVAQARTRNRRRRSAASARNAAASTLRKAPRVNTKTARPISGRASSASGGAAKPISSEVPSQHIASARAEAPFVVLGALGGE